MCGLFAEMFELYRQQNRSAGHQIAAPPRKRAILPPKKARKIKRSAVAGGVGVSPPAVSQWLKGQTLPKSENVYALGRVLGLSPSEHRRLIGAWSISYQFRNALTYVKRAEAEKNRQLMNALRTEKITSIQLPHLANLFSLNQVKQRMGAGAEINLFAPALEGYMEQQEVIQIRLAERLFREPAVVLSWRTGERLPGSAEDAYEISQALELPALKSLNLALCWQVTKYIRALSPCVEAAESDRNGAVARYVYDLCALSIIHVNSEMSVEE